MRVFNVNNWMSCALLIDSGADQNKKFNRNSNYLLKIHSNCNLDTNSRSEDSWMKMLNKLRNTLNKMNVLCLEPLTYSNKLNLAQVKKKEPIAPITNEIFDQIRDNTSEFWVETGKKITDVYGQIRKKTTNALTFDKNQNEAGVIPEKKIKRRAYRPKKVKNYLVKYRFNFANPISTFPVFLFYEQENSELITLKIAQSFNNYWYERYYNSIQNLSSNKVFHQDKDEHNLEYICTMDKDPHLKLAWIAEIFDKLEEQFSINILGVFLDPYFISRQDRKLVADHIVDKRSSLFIEDPTSLSDALIQHELLDSDKSKGFQFDFKITETNLDVVDQQSQSNENVSSSENSFISTDSDSMGSNSDSEKLPVLAEETDKNVINSVPIVSEDDSSSLEEKNLSQWNPEIREKINHLLLDYQKHLTKQYFFRSKTITMTKQSMTTVLLNKLNNSTLNEFTEHMNFTTTNILNEHRDSSFIQKLGFFFKNHSETKGAQLLNNIIKELKENHLEINILSV